ncbi:MAG: DNA mismatch endonuclease Vsr [Firmicutes bacterium]|nr:DNA mismatch endonuclease Vsr [Bacillota bacterium]MDY6159845.1 DNA mismatch endonuclease Vsr [Candidatus Faecousia sp.]
MADTKTPAERSENMSRIRSTNTKPEEIVRKYLFSHGFRYRKNDKCYPGKPDIVLSKYRTIIFVNGCFWHMHGCSRSRLPRSNQDYWKPKIERNIQRDADNKQKLELDGWKVIVVWECELKKRIAEERLSRLCEEINGNYNFEKYKQIP